MSHLHAEIGSHALVASIPSQSGWASRLLAAVPALCFIHCVGTVLLALLLPAAASLWSTGEWLEAPLWMLSLVVVGMTLYRRQQVRDVPGVVFSLGLVVGLLGFVADLEFARRVSLLGLVVVQVLSWQRAPRLAVAKACGCPQHHRRAA